MPIPSKEQLREWLGTNRKLHRPPPSPEQTRQELDWTLTKQEAKEKNNRYV